MADQILDSDLFFEEFKIPKTYKVASDKWMNVCSELQKKSIIGIFIVVAFGLLVSFFLGTIVLIGIVFFGMWSFFSLSKRFSGLRSLAEHSFIISSTQISDQSAEETITILFNELKSIELHGYGIDLESKINQDKITIPVSINDYDRVLSFFEQVKTTI